MGDHLPRAGGVGALVTQLDEEQVPQTELFLTEVDSVDGPGRPRRALRRRHLLAVAARRARRRDLDDTLALVSDHPGVAAPTTRGRRAAAPVFPLPSEQDPTQPKIVDGQAVVFATLSDPADSQAATDTMRDLRTDLDEISPDILVGGSTAINADTRDVTGSDRAKVIPAILAVIFVVLALLLRALVAPLLLIIANVLSFGATHRHLRARLRVRLRLPRLRPVDVADRVRLPGGARDRLLDLPDDPGREESIRQGTHPGILKGLSATGGVITSAGVVLAATFAALGVIPILFLAQIGFIVAFGVLLDALVVRSLLVPALSYDVGRWIWWPSKLSRETDHADAETQRMLRGRAPGAHRL